MRRIVTDKFSIDVFEKRLNNLGFVIEQLVGDLYHNTEGCTFDY
jgi:hypothetical protein